MATIAVCQRKIFSSLFCPLLQLSQLMSYTIPVRIHLRFASFGKQSKFVKNNAASKAVLGINGITEEQESPKLIKLFDEAGLLLPVVEKDEAMKLATLKDLRLVQINEDKLEPHYQLMTGRQLNEVRLQQRKSKKDKPSVEKTLHIRSNISEHDLGIKLSKIKALLEKDFNMRIKIKVSKSKNEIESRQIQSKLLKRITEETSSIANVKEASSTTTELIILLRKKLANV